VVLPRLLAAPDIDTVRSVARRPLPPHPKLTHTRADLRDPEARRALAGVDVLWHLGFALWRARGGRRTGPPANALGANLAGTANLLAGRPGRVVLASSVAVYGAWPDNRLPLRETDPARPNAECAYAADKLAVERLCAEAAAAAILRIGAVLGPHADRRAARAALGYRRVVPAVRGATQALQFVREDDVAAALLAAGRGTPTGVFNIATDDWLSAGDVARIGGGRVVALPRASLIGASEAAFHLGLLPFGADRAALLNGPLAADCALAAVALRWRPTRRSADVLAEALGRPGYRSRW
jgi:nucleoside-diphosphate-sugar epimerase